MTPRHTLRKARTATALTAIVVVAGGWMAQGVERPLSGRKPMTAFDP